MTWYGVVQSLPYLPFIISFLVLLSGEEWIVEEKVGQLVSSVNVRGAVKDLYSMISLFESIFKHNRFSAIYSNLAILAVLPSMPGSSAASDPGLHLKFVKLFVFMLLYNGVLVLLSRRLQRDYKQMQVKDLHSKYIVVTGKTYLLAFGSLLTVLPSVVTFVARRLFL